MEWKEGTFYGGPSGVMYHCAIYSDAHYWWFYKRPLMAEECMPGTLAVRPEALEQIRIDVLARYHNWIERVEHEALATIPVSDG